MEKRKGETTGDRGNGGGKEGSVRKGGRMETGPSREGFVVEEGRNGG